MTIVRTRVEAVDQDWSAARISAGGAGAGGLDVGSAEMDRTLFLERLRRL